MYYHTKFNIVTIKIFSSINLGVIIMLKAIKKRLCISLLLLHLATPIYSSEQAEHNDQSLLCYLAIVGTVISATLIQDLIEIYNTKRVEELISDPSLIEKNVINFTKKDPKLHAVFSQIKQDIAIKEDVSFKYFRAYPKIPDILKS